MRLELARVVSLGMGLLAVTSSTSRADTETTPGTLHARAGYTSGKFSSTNQAVTGSFSVPTTLDLEYELPNAAKESWGFRFTLADDLSKSRTFYLFSGINRHYYFLSSGVANRANENGYVVESTPQWRLYAGWSAGIAQAIAQTIGDVYQADTTLAEVGAHAGAIYQLSPKIGIDAQIGASVGYGFTSISVGAYILKFYLGVALSM